MVRVGIKFRVRFRARVRCDIARYRIRLVDRVRVGVRGRVEVRGRVISPTSRPNSRLTFS